jgi:hypothetical protein
MADPPLLAVEIGPAERSVIFHEQVRVFRPVFGDRYRHRTVYSAGPFRMVRLVGAEKVLAGRDGEPAVRHRTEEPPRGIEERLGAKDLHSLGVVIVFDGLAQQIETQKKPVHPIERGDANHVRLG